MTRPNTPGDPDPIPRPDTPGARNTTTERDVDPVAASLTVGSAVAFFLVAVVLFLTPPASGYEFSVYDGYPLAFWLLVLTALLAGQLVVVRAFHREEASPLLWRLGLGTVVATEALLFALPYFRGYPVYGRADVLVHVGFVRSTTDLGTLVPGDIYPNIHLLTATLSHATGVDPLSVINAVAVVVPVFSVFAWYALVRRLYDNERALLSVPFVTLFVGASAYTNPSPYVQSALLVPFLLYLFVREHQTRTLAVRAALVVAVVGVTIYHPLTTLFSLVGLSAYVLVAAVRGGDDATPAGLNTVGNSTTLHLMAGVFVSWYYSTWTVRNKTENALRPLLGRAGGQSDLNKYTSTVEETSPKLVDLVTVAVADYGLTVIITGVVGLFLLVVGYRRLTGADWPGKYERWFALSALAFGAVSLVFLLVDLPTGFGRPLLFIRVFGVLLVGPLFYYLYQVSERRRLVTGCLCALLFLYATFGLVTLYHSPMKSQPSHQVTDAELDGTEWFFEHRELNSEIIQHGIDTGDFGHAYHGVNKSEPRQYLPPRSEPPDHYGYDRNLTLGSSYEGDRYLVVVPAGREFYPEMYPDYRDQWRYEPADFERLERDPTVNRVYDNGEVDFYRVAGE